MGQDLEVAKKNQDKINFAAGSLPVVSKKGLRGIGKTYFTQGMEHIEEIKQILEIKEVTWFIYQDGLARLKMDIDNLVRFLKQGNKEVPGLEAKKRILVLTLQISIEFLASVIRYIEGEKTPKQDKYVPEIVLFQQKIEKGLDVCFPGRERIFNIDLDSLTEDYENAYVKDYGQGCLGFFKLPIKRFFRQDSRTEELQFIEDVHTYLQTDGKQLTPETKEQMKLSTLNLVRLKLDTEPFSEGSQLYRLIDARLSAVGCLRNKEIIDDFINVCQKGSIRVPLSLTSFYENDLEINSPAL